MRVKWLHKDFLHSPQRASHLLLLLEPEAVAEGLAAFPTLLGLLLGVDLVVGGQLHALSEGLEALAVLVWPFLSMNQLVAQGEGAQLERLAILCALEGLGLCVHNLMPEQQ